MTTSRPDSSTSVRRRDVLGTTLAAGAMFGLGGMGSPLAAAEPEAGPIATPPAVPPMDPDLAAYLNGPTAKQFTYFTPTEKHGANYHSKLKPWDLTPEQLVEARLTRETWTLDIVMDKEGKRKLLEQPRSLADNNAITFADLLRLYEQRPVKLLKTMTCLMAGGPAGTSLWEGVALRDVLWLAKPTGPIRRIAIVALNLEDPTKDEWCGSLPPARVFEDPVGMAPVILALKLNGDWLPVRQGGPVRLIAQEHYGFKNTRHVRRIAFSNEHAATDNYARSGQDVESPMKTCAQHMQGPAKSPAGKPLIITGQVQVGMSGLRSVQYAVTAADAPTAEDDPYLQKLPWQDGVVLPPPADFAAKIPGGAKGVFGLDDKGAPIVWPIPGFVAYWAAVIRDLKPGQYSIYARAVNRNGDAQPLPRPFDVSGVTRLPSKTVEITA